ncbi:MAG TPA: 30S ribosomal protein S20 [Candidatus Polarisedimenticolia bacterium]|nr:30S ribosomal protein S20 [Candidatus Polarisedimenticolia bacterium]
MATHKSAIKRHAQSLKRNASNRANRSELRTEIKKLRATVEQNDAAEARRMLPATLSLIDRSIQKGVLHDNTAARQKSRLTRLVNSIGSAGKTSTGS